MYYLDAKMYDKISKSVEIRSINSLGRKRLSKKDFDCGIDEYNSFLFDDALSLDKKNISKTFLMIHIKTKTIVGYFSLATDNIKLTTDEKINSKLEDVAFRSFPAIKLGKLAINKDIPNSIRIKGYGSFILNIIDYYAYQVAEIGVGCRFITVDADIEYDKDTDKFYLKNGFKYNENYKNVKSETISMRRDVYGI